MLEKHSSLHQHEKSNNLLKFPQLTFDLYCHRVYKENTLVGDFMHKTTESLVKLIQPPSYSWVWMFQEIILSEIGNIFFYFMSAHTFSSVAFQVCTEIQLTQTWTYKSSPLESWTDTPGLFNEGNNTHEEDIRGTVWHPTALGYPGELEINLG